MLSETTTAYVRLLVFFRIRHGTFPYGVEDDVSTIRQTPTTHYTNTCVKLTKGTQQSLSERIAIAILSLHRNQSHSRSAEQGNIYRSVYARKGETFPVLVRARDCRLARQVRRPRPASACCSFPTFKAECGAYLRGSSLYSTTSI